MTPVPANPKLRDSYELARRIGLAWREIRRGASTSDLREFLYGGDEESIEQGQMDTLDLLALRPSWRMSELAEALRVEPSTATRAVQRLVNAGLATRSACSDDGRVVQVEVSEAGRTAHDLVSARRAELMTHILGAYSRAELPVLADMLERFVAAVDDFMAVHRPDA
ncbi:MAG: MarR family transcriptional regulator [Actinomycetota bacterium]|nr:MarR family transcriptional regulator [Actinomycetota bacterium]